MNHTNNGISFQDKDDGTNSDDALAEKSRKRAVRLEEEYERKRLKQFALQREVKAPKPFPFAALGPTLGTAAKRIHEIVKAPDAICGQSVLAVASLITQAYADIHIDGRVHPLSLFMLTVGESGDRKSAVDSVALKPVRDYERMLVESYKLERKAYKNKLEVWKKRRDQTSSSSEIKELEEELSKLEDEPIKPLEPHLLLEEPSYEGLVKLFAIGQPSLGLFSDEGGRMFGGYALGKDNVLKTACGLSSLWDGKPMTRIRGADENLILYGRRFSTHLMIQENVHLNVQKNDLLVGQGLIARFLIVYPPSNAGNRPYNEVDVSQDPAILKFWEQTANLLDKPLSLAKQDVPNELAPRHLSLDPEAKKHWIGFHDEIDIGLKPDGILWPIRRSANKAAEQTLRIAGVLTLFEDFEATSISLMTLQRAIELVRFYLDEAIRIGEIASSDPDLELAQATYNWMKKKAAESGSQKTFTLQDIYQKAGPRAVRSKKAAERILKILEEHGLVFRQEPDVLEWKLLEYDE